MKLQAFAAVLSAAILLCTPSVSSPASSTFSSSPSKQTDLGLVMGMKPGDTSFVNVPYVGGKPLTLDHYTKGESGSLYWHGHVSGDFLSKVSIKRLPSGDLIGAARINGKVVSFKQTSSGRVTPFTSSRVSAQAWSVGKQISAGIYETNVRLATIYNASVGSEVSVALPNGGEYSGIVTSFEVDKSGTAYVSGVGKIGGSSEPFAITVGGNAVFAAIFTDKGELQLQTKNGQTTLFDTKGSGMTEPKGVDYLLAPPDKEPYSQAAIVQTTTSGTTTTSTTAPPNVVPLPAGTVNTVLPILVTYSPSFVQLWGGEQVARTRISNLLQVANLAYSNSGTGIQLRIVGWKLVNQADATPQVTLPALRMSSGAFTGISTLKSSVGAVMVTFFSPFNSTTGATNTCGLAYIPAAGSQGLSAFQSQVPALAFSSLNDGQKGSSYCSALSFAHELGHNLGAVHDKPNSTNTGVFPYSYGKGVAGSFGTIMSYTYPRVALFSSPLLTCTSSGTPCGTDSENVVATFLQTKPYVAALGKSTAASVGITGTNVIAGKLVLTDGSAYTGSATLTPSVAGVACSAPGNGLYVCTVPTSVTSVTVSVSVSGRVVTPTQVTFPNKAISERPLAAPTVTVN